MWPGVTIQELFGILFDCRHLDVLLSVQQVPQIGVLKVNIRRPSDHLVTALPYLFLPVELGPVHSHAVEFLQEVIRLLPVVLTDLLSPLPLLYDHLLTLIAVLKQLHLLISGF